MTVLRSEFIGKLLVLSETLYMMNKSITQPITKACLFSKQCLLKSVTVLVQAFSCLFSSHAYFQKDALYRANTVSMTRK